MKTIYVLTSGDYSDYKIVAIYDTKEMAEAMRISLNPNEAWPITIEEWPLNPYSADLQKKYIPYEVIMGKNGDGYVSNRPECASLGYPGNIDVDFPNNSINMVTICFAKDEKHALKIANERRVQIIAANTWGIERPITAPRHS